MFRVVLILSLHFLLLIIIQFQLYLTLSLSLAFPCMHCFQQRSFFLPIQSLKAIAKQNTFPQSGIIQKRQLYLTSPFLIQPLQSSLNPSFSLPLRTQQTTMFSSLKPSLPSSLFNENGIKLKQKLVHDLETIEKELSTDQDQRDSFFRLNRKVNIQSHEILQLLRNGQVDFYPNAMQAIDQNVQQLLESIGNDIVERESRLTLTMEKVLLPKLLYYYYQNSQLQPISLIQPTPTDTEYLCAVFSFAAELSRYTINRACQFDFPSIHLSKELISEIYQILLEFDFRNGLLRRRFDSVKYSLKSIENIYYELNLQFNLKSTDHQQQLPPPSTSLPFASSSLSDGMEDLSSEKQLQKKARLEEQKPVSPSEPNIVIDSNTHHDNTTLTNNQKKRYQYLSEEEFQDLINRQNQYDQARELIIKESRDIQKMAKQAIYAVIRNQLEDARKKLNFCQQKSLKLHQEVIEKYPTLRQGSYANSLEEYAEGELLYHWIANQELISKSQLPSILKVHDYVNGLADFTGEIGRLAVMYASERKLPPIQDIQQLDIVIYDYLTTLNIISNNSFSKKMEMIYMNMKKIDDILYELILLQKTGKLYHFTTNEAPNPSNNNNKEGQKEDEIDA